MDVIDCLGSCRFEVGIGDRLLLASYIVVTAGILTSWVRYTYAKQFYQTQTKSHWIYSCSIAEKPWKILLRQYQFIRKLIKRNECICKYLWFFLYVKEVMYISIPRPHWTPAATSAVLCLHTELSSCCWWYCTNWQYSLTLSLSYMLTLWPWNVTECESLEMENHIVMYPGCSLNTFFKPPICVIQCYIQIIHSVFCEFYICMHIYATHTLVIQWHTIFYSVNWKELEREV